MSQKKTSSTLVDLLLGGWLGAGFSLIMGEIMSRLFEHLSLQSNLGALLLLNLFPHFLGGMVAAILVQRRLRTNPSRNGAIIGLSSVIIYTVITAHINLYILASFVSGSYIGGILARRMLYTSK